MTVGMLIRKKCIKKLLRNWDTLSLTTTNKCLKYPEWTISKFNSFIKSALRAASSRWPPSYLCMKEAFVGVKTNVKTGRKAKHYRCNSCHGEFPSSEVQREDRKSTRLNS